MASSSQSNFQLIQNVVTKRESYDSTIVSGVVLELFICLSGLVTSPLFNPLLLSISAEMDDPLFLDDPLLRLVVVNDVTVLESHFDLGLVICLLMVLKVISSSSEMEDDSDSSEAEDNGLKSPLFPRSARAPPGFSIPFWVQFEVQLLADLIGENLLMILKARSPEAGEAGWGGGVSATSV